MLSQFIPFLLLLLLQLQIEPRNFLGGSNLPELTQLPQLLQYCSGGVNLCDWLHSGCCCIASK
jgi:hypothetical protein